MFMIMTDSSFPSLGEWLMSHRSIVASVACSVIIAISAIVSSAAPESKEVPRLLWKNLRLEGQGASKNPIEVPRKKFMAIDADLEAGTWGFTRTPCMQVSYLVKDEPTITFPEQVFTHPTVESDPCLRFSAMVYRGDKFTKENVVAGTVALFANEVKPWEAKVRYLLVTPDEPGEYTIVFDVYEDKELPNGVDPKDIMPLGQQKIVIR